jgi:hypothetical protein
MCVSRIVGLRTWALGIFRRPVRLSLDIRLLPASDRNRPIVERIAAVEAGSLTVETATARRVITVTSETFLRKRTRDRLDISGLAEAYNVGEAVVVTERDDVAITVRPVVY